MINKQTEHIYRYELHHHHHNTISAYGIDWIEFDGDGCIILLISIPIHYHVMQTHNLLMKNTRKSWENRNSNSKS